MRAVLTLTLSSVLLLPITSFADICEDVVADTIAEMRAGADGRWSDDLQDLVRAAAGSACVKAQSGRYATSQQRSLDRSEAVVSSALPEAPAASADSSPVAAEQTSETSETSEEKDDGSWSVGGLTFRSMSGSPTQKPYERARQNKKAEQQ